MDSFITDLSEQTKVANKDYTVFDIQDVTTGKYNTRKVSYDTIYNQLVTDVTTQFNTQFTKIDKGITEAKASANSKLDKKGTNLNLLEKMTGPLLVDTFSATGLSYFKNTVDLGSNYISNVKDPRLDQDAATKIYVDTYVNGKVANLTTSTNFLKNTGDKLIAGDLELNRDPRQPFHATNKKWVEDKISNATSTVQQTITSNISNAYVPLSGGTMTGSLVLKGFSEQTPSVITPANNKVTLNLNTGNTFSINLNANVTEFILTNAPSAGTYTITLAIKNTGNFTVAWNTFDNQTVKWAGGGTPTMTTGATKTDIYCLTYIAQTWYGFIGGQSFQ